MVVVGIDLGALNCTVSHIGRGQVHIALNEASQRQTPNMVGFTDECRVIGAAAEQSFSFNSANTITSVTRFLGLKYSQIPQEDLDSLTCEYSRTENDEILFHVSYLGQDCKFTSIEVAAMLLGRLKEIAEKESGQVGVEAVIAVPAYYSDPQFRALAASAQIAGIRVLRAMPTLTAAAIEYGLYKDNLPKKDEKPIHVAFIDVGYSDTAISILAITESKVTVVSTAYDRHLGGRDFENALFEHFADEIKKNNDLDVRSNDKAVKRLRAACEKIKKILSANTVAKTHIECLLNDKDVSLSMERDTFEQLANSFINKFEVPILKAVDASGLKPEDIVSVEAIGGSTYMPSIRQILSNIFKRDVTSSTNPMESVARGCAIQGAMLSRSTRLAKDFQVADIVIHPIDIGYNTSSAMVDDHEVEKRTALFKFGEDITQSLIMTFKRNQDFELVALYKDMEAHLPNTNPVLGVFSIRGVPKKEENTAVRTRMKIDMLGRFLVDEAWWEEKVEYEEEKKVEMTEEEIKAAAQESAKDEPMSETEGEGEVKESEKKVPEKQYKIVKETKVRTVKHNLQIVERIDQISPEQLIRFTKNQSEMALRDYTVASTNEAKNALESYGYETMDKLYEGGELYDFIEASIRDKFSEDLQNAVDWLYGDGENEKKETYDKKLNDLKQIGTPAAFRAAEFESRPRLINDLRNLICQAREFAQTQDEQYAHIGAEDRTTILQKADSLDNWLATEEGKQNALPKFQNPVLTTALLRERIVELNNVVRPIMNKPPPPPPKEDPAPAPSQESPTDNADASKESV